MTEPTPHCCLDQQTKPWPWLVPTAYLLMAVMAAFAIIYPILWAVARSD